MGAAFELCQLPSSWSVLYILFLNWYSVPDWPFRGHFSPLFHSSNNPFCSFFLCPHLAPFSLLQPLCNGPDDSPYLQRRLWEPGWEGSRQQCISASDPESVLKAYGKYEKGNVPSVFNRGQGIWCLATLLCSLLILHNVIFWCCALLGITQV